MQPRSRFIGSRRGLQIRLDQRNQRHGSFGMGTVRKKVVMGLQSGGGGGKERVCSGLDERWGSSGMGGRILGVVGDWFRLEQRSCSRLYVGCLICWHRRVRV